MAMIDEREERRKAKLEALRAEIQKGLDSGPAEEFDPKELFARIKSEGRKRLAASKRGDT
jgi:antitoxin ParD1/3/4